MSGWWFAAAMVLLALVMGGLTLWLECREGRDEPPQGMGCDFGIGLIWFWLTHRK